MSCLRFDSLSEAKMFFTSDSLRVLRNFRIASWRAITSAGVGDSEPIDEARAGRGEVEGEAAGDAELALDAHGGRGEGAVGGGGRDEDAIHLVHRRASIGQRLARGFKAEVGGCLLRRRDVALLDAGAFADPFV